MSIIYFRSVEEGKLAELVVTFKFMITVFANCFDLPAVLVEFLLQHSCLHPQIASQKLTSAWGGVTHVTGFPFPKST
jgi:hypothetical protein